MADGGQLARWADRGTAGVFHRRYGRDSVDFWVTRLAEFGRLRPADRVLDVGCGTGGFSLGLARRVGARVIACDLSPSFIQYASASEPSLGWLVADAHHLPVADRSIDCVIMALLIHRLPDPGRAIVEAHRVLRAGGTLVIKTIAPADAAGTLPYRLFPTMAAAQRARMPEVSMIEAWASAAGFIELSVQRVHRERLIESERLASAVIADAPTRYPDLGDDELRSGLKLLREEAELQPVTWTEGRTATLVRGTRVR